MPDLVNFFRLKPILTVFTSTYSIFQGRLGHLTTESTMPEEAEKPGVDCNQYEDIDRETEFERSIFRFKDGDWSHKASLSANLPLFWNFITPTEKGIGLTFFS